MLQGADDSEDRISATEARYLTREVIAAQCDSLGDRLDAICKKLADSDWPPPPDESPTSEPSLH